MNLSDGGYLYDPDSEFGGIYNPDLVSFERLAERPCLILLGEPGIGKTRSLGTHIQATKARVKKEGGHILDFDLRAYGSEDRLARSLARQYPYSEDPKHDEAYEVTSRDKIVDFKSSVLNVLANRGTFEACSAMQRLVAELPDLTWLKWSLLDAKAVARVKTWVPPAPAEIVRLASAPELRLVQGGEQLLSVLIESLERLEKRLQGETPAAIDIWNELPGKTYRPRDENRVSDYLKRHFEDDIRGRGIILNREVEIRRGEGDAKGERTDIQVDALTKGTTGTGYDQLTAIIEVKGCWNEGLFQAMETQLLNRYMSDSLCRYGLYVVGWFVCDQWDKEDSRSKQTPKMSAEEVRERLTSQAANLSQGGNRIQVFVLSCSLGKGSGS